MSKARKPRARRAVGGEMTEEEQLQFMQLAENEEAARNAARAAQTEANEIAQRATLRENELADQVQRAQQRETELAAQVQRAQQRDAQMSSERALYDRALYDRINTRVLDLVPLSERMRLAAVVSDMTRSKLSQGMNESAVVSELMDMVRTLSQKVERAARAAPRTVPRARSSKKKKRASSKKKRPVKK